MSIGYSILGNDIILSVICDYIVSIHSYYKDQDADITSIFISRI